MTPQAFAALEESDRLLGHLLSALEEAGMLHSTLVFVVSDHGFLPASKTLKPNVLLREAGLIQGEPDAVSSVDEDDHAVSRFGDEVRHGMLPEICPSVLHERAVIEALAPMVTAEDSGIHRLHTDGGTERRTKTCPVQFTTISAGPARLVQCFDSSWSTRRRRATTSSSTVANPDRAPRTRT